jgi:low affinity Fe/Cu permease
MPAPEHHREPPPASDFARREAIKQSRIRAWFSSFANASASAVGSPFTFLAAIIVVIVWASLGPVYHYSDTWQLVINTGTTIITFLMVFLIQNTQNRDAKAIHLKLNELIHGTKHAQNELIEVEKLSDEELKELEKHYDRIRKECERRRSSDKNPDSKNAA